MEWSHDDEERIEEIRNLPTSVIADAFNWWNSDSYSNMKRWIVVSSYYEFLAQSSEYADEILEEWS